MQQCRRSGALFGLLSIGVLVVAAMTASPTQAATSNGPYYATPSWDQKLPAATRYVMLTDWNSEAVLDRETGLVWEREPESITRVWVGQLEDCANRRIGGRKGWRLPSMHELASLIDNTIQTNPSLPVGHPFSNVLPDSEYWSATMFTGSPSRAWFVRFFTGRVFTANMGDLKLAWCVRGGGPLSEY